jgi:hypothetical protein
VGAHIPTPGRIAIRTSLAITIRLLFAALLASACALGQQPAQTLHGAWIATAGRGKVFHGTWAGATLPHQQNVAEGTWTLTSAGQMVLEGTWRAEKSSRSWEGRWTGRTVTGQALGGSWGADLEHWHGKTLQQMLELTMVEEVSGWWQSGRAQGNWWLRGPRNPSSR